MPSEGIIKDTAGTDPAQEPQITALLRYVTRPTDEQIEGFRAFLARRYSAETAAIASSIRLELREDPSIKNGFILEVGDEVYDWSQEGRTGQLRSRLQAFLDRNPDADKATYDQFITILKEDVNAFRLAADSMEVGHVLSVGDGIAWMDGLNHVMYGEIVIFEDGTKGMVQSIEESRVGAILFGDEAAVHQGERAARSGRMAGLPVGDAFLGRIVNALGAPIDGLGEIEAADYRAVEQPAPGIADREPVCEPLQTGILSIDAMFPIGRGQRELIIGDRQTGKTSIAVDTILNQKGQNCYCVYVAIGQKASTVAQVVQTLRSHGAMDYTVVVSATAADPAPLQYIAPYAGASLAEYFMYSGRDALIIYDDLSKHAVAYRTLSLLLGRAPGREAFPGDVFYLHSRLLERASRLTKRLGGGSMTALPIIETQDGDVSAYIPTNVISITDGQIFLESDLFFEGQRPAVNVGLSVSRVGGAAQTAAMKKAVGSLRIDLAQYREMAVFTQFSSDLDEATIRQLSQGRILMELLKQPLSHPIPMEDQVILLVTAVSGSMIAVPPKKMRDTKAAYLEYMHREKAELLQRIRRSGRLSEGDREEILSGWESFEQEQ